MPVVIDIRDLWPDVFANAFPRPIRRLGELALKPMFAQARRICREADALVGVSQAYLDWGLRLAERDARTSDRVYPLGFEQPTISPQQRAEALRKIDGLGVDRSKTLCCFAGVFERSYDLETVIRAAARLAAAGRDDLQFIVCGEGSRLQRLLRIAAPLPNMVFTGWLDGSTLAVLRSISAVGLAAYAADATQGLPNKPFEYLASGMATVSSLQGELLDLMQRHDCGVTYTPGDDAQLAAILGRLCVGGEAQRLGENGRTLWTAEYRASEVYKRCAEDLEAFAAPVAAGRRLAA